MFLNDDDEIKKENMRVVNERKSERNAEELSNAIDATLADIAYLRESCKVCYNIVRYTTMAIFGAFIIIGIIDGLQADPFTVTNLLIKTSLFAVMGVIVSALWFSVLFYIFYIPQKMKEYKYISMGAMLVGIMFFIEYLMNLK